MLVFLFTDIEGSSRLWEEHTEAMTAVIARHDEILREQVEAAGGRITKHTGDGITAAFQGGQPLSCALETQLRFTAEPWGEIGELRIRVGLNAGEAEFHASAGTPDGDYFGPPVNATARVMSAAWGGQVLLTPEVSEVSTLPDQATLIDTGEHLLKDISAPQKLYQLDHPQLTWHKFPPLRTLSGRSIHQVVGDYGGQLAALDPQAMGISLLAATLLPTLQGELDPEAGALQGNLGVLEELDVLSLRDFVLGFAERLRISKSVPVDELQFLLQHDLQAQWQAGDEAALALRSDASRLLQAVNGVEAAMTAANEEVKGALARGLAGLGTQFAEFQWMLSGVQDTLAEMRARQALQLALQREQLDLQRQQLVKTNLLLHRQRQGPPVAELTVKGDVEEQPPADVPCPYKGLAAFEADDAEYFFGREELVAEMTARLAGTRFLAVVGPSGSGKSSLVRAGLLPAIWSGALPASQDWLTLVLTPGSHPLEELAVRIALLDGYTAGSLLRELEEDHRSLHLAVKQALAGKPDAAKLLLVVDQFEEIFALCRDEDECQRFIDALLYAIDVEGGRTIVVPTIRADFIGRCAEYPALAARMSDSLLVGPMSETELRQAIEGPADIVGLQLEPGLPETILGDVAGEPGALPLMSHALMETFARRRGRTLTLSGYAASGGVAGAIAQTADTVYEGLDDEERVLVRSVFLRLTELGEEGAQDTRRRVAPSELVRREEESTAVESLLHRLADARLVTTGEDTVEVTHEALIREWPLLREWLDEDREGLRVHRHLTVAAVEWERLECDPGELYRGARLASAAEWSEAHEQLLNPLEREFLAASKDLAWRRQAEKEAQQQRELEAAQALAAEQQKRAEQQAQAAGRLRQRALLLGVALVMALIAVVAAAFLWNRSSNQARLAASRELSMAAQSDLEVDPERSILLALQAFSMAHTTQAEQALHQAVVASRVRQSLPGMDSEVLSVAYSPDGTRLATATEDGTAFVWDAASEEEILSLPGQIIVYSPNGARLATATGDGTVTVWDAATGQELLTLEGHTNWLNDLVFSPDGRYMASASTDGTVRVWDATRGQEMFTIQAPSAGYLTDNSVLFVPGDKYLVTADVDAVVTVWDVATGDKLLELAGRAPMAVSPDGKLLATTTIETDRGILALWDLEASLSSGSGVALPTGGAQHESMLDMEFSPDGSRLATSSQDATARIWMISPDGIQESLSLDGHTGAVHDLAFSPDGRFLITGSQDGLTRIWDISPGGNQEILTQAGHYPYLRRVAYSPDGSRLATTNREGEAVIMDAETGETLIVFAHPNGTVWEAAFSPDGSLLATAGEDNTVRLWDANEGQELLTLTGHAEAQPIGYVFAGITAVAFSPDGELLASAGADGMVILWDTETGEHVQTLQVHPDGIGVTAVAFSPDGTRLAAASDERDFSNDPEGGRPLVKVWDLSSGQELYTVTGLPNRAFALAFSPDSTRLAVGVGEDFVKVFDATTGEESISFPGHSGYIIAVTFSPDGALLATAGNDPPRLWDLTTGQELVKLSGHISMVNGLSFSPDGSRLASSSIDGTTRVYTLNIDELIALAQSRLTRWFTQAECRQYLNQETCPERP